jgi:hypothetical protein
MDRLAFISFRRQENINRGLRASAWSTKYGAILVARERRLDLKNHFRPVLLDPRADDDVLPRATPAFRCSVFRQDSGPAVFQSLDLSLNCGYVLNAHIHPVC